MKLNVDDMDKALAFYSAKLGFEVERHYPRQVSLKAGDRVKLMLYNFGYRVPEMQAARDFYSNKLGFIVRSEKYLPLDLPLGHKDNTFAFMLHYRPNIQPIKSAYPSAVPLNVFVFETDDLKKAIAALKKAGVKVLNERPQNSPMGSFVAFEDPFGNVSELVGNAAVSMKTLEKTPGI